jgi:hypothetical protein
MSEYQIAALVRKPVQSRSTPKGNPLPLKMPFVEYGPAVPSLNKKNVSFPQDAIIKTCFKAFPSISVREIANGYLFLWQEASPGRSKTGKDM